MLIVDGPEKVGTRISTYSSTSNKATITDLPGGTYKVVFYPYLAPVSTQTINGKSVAYYPVNHNCLIEKTINIPEYIRPVIDIPYSGGISCTDGLTNMTITVGWGNKPDFSYRYKVKNAADNTYDPANFQPSNVFSDVSPGDYTVQIKDQCGSITTQNVHVFDGTEQFVGIIGEVQPGVICEGRDVTLSVLSIGPVQWYEWYYSATGEDGTWTTLPSTNPTYVINSATQSDKGYYKVKINNGLCDLESEVHIVDVIAPAATPSITGEVHDICAGQSTTLTAHTSITSPSYRWYKDGVAITGAYSDTYQVVATGSYTVDVTPPLACSSDQSLPYVVTALQLAQPIISPTSASICIGDKITLTATTSDTGVSYTWYKNNVQVHYSSTSNTYDASESGTYTVKTTHIQLGCISPLSVGVVVTVNPIPSVAISAAPGFEVCESNVTEITFTATPTNGGVNPTYAWKVNGAPAGTEATLTLNNLKQYRPKSTVSCTMTSDNVACSTTTATDEKNIRISSCVVPVNPSIRGRISN
jgi:hypothetical protein